MYREIKLFRLQGNNTCKFPAQLDFLKSKPLSNGNSGLSFTKLYPVLISVKLQLLILRAEGLKVLLISYKLL